MKKTNKKKIIFKSTVLGTTILGSSVGIVSGLTSCSNYYIITKDEIKAMDTYNGDLLSTHNAFIKWKQLSDKEKTIDLLSSFLYLNEQQVTVLFQLIGNDLYSKRMSDGTSTEDFNYDMLTDRMYVQRFLNDIMPRLSIHVIKSNFRETTLQNVYTRSGEFINPECVLWNASISFDSTDGLPLRFLGFDLTALQVTFTNVPIASFTYSGNFSFYPEGYSANDFVDAIIINANQSDTGGTFLSSLILDNTMFAAAGAKVVLSSAGELISYFNTTGMSINFDISSMMSVMTSLFDRNSSAEWIETIRFSLQSMGATDSVTGLSMYDLKSDFGSRNYFVGSPFYSKYFGSMPFYTPSGYELTYGITSDDLVFVGNDVNAYTANINIGNTFSTTLLFVKKFAWIDQYEDNTSWCSIWSSAVTNDSVLNDLTWSLEKVPSGFTFDMNTGTLSTLNKAQTELKETIGINLYLGSTLLDSSHIRIWTAYKDYFIKFLNDNKASFYIDGYISHPTFTFALYDEFDQIIHNQSADLYAKELTATPVYNTRSSISQAKNGYYNFEYSTTPDNYTSSPTLKFQIEYKPNGESMVDNAIEVIQLKKPTATYYYTTNSIGPTDNMLVMFDTFCENIKPMSTYISISNIDSATIYDENENDVTDKFNIGVQNSSVYNKQVINVSIKSGSDLTNGTYHLKPQIDIAWYSHGSTNVENYNDLQDLHTFTVTGMGN